MLPVGRRVQAALLVLLIPVLTGAWLHRVNNPEVINLPERRGESWSAMEVPGGAGAGPVQFYRTELERTGKSGAVEARLVYTLTEQANPEQFEVAPGERDEIEELLAGAGEEVRLVSPVGRKLSPAEWRLVEGFVMRSSLGEEATSPVHDILSDLAFFRASLDRIPESTEELLAGVYPPSGYRSLQPENRTALLAPYLPPPRSTPLRVFRDSGEPLSLTIRPLKLPGSGRERIIELLRLRPPEPPAGWQGAPPLGRLYLVTVRGRSGDVILRWVYASFAARGGGRNGDG